MLAWIDNLGIFSALIKGRSSVLDLSPILLAWDLQLCKAKVSVWFEHVESKANCADGGSRVGTACPIAKQLGLSLQEIQFPEWPADVMSFRVAQWLDLLRTGIDSL